jgi:hypothetical protein
MRMSLNTSMFHKLHITAQFYGMLYKIIIIILSHFGPGGLLRSQISVLAVFPMISFLVVCTMLLVLAIWCLSCVQCVISVVLCIAVGRW